MYHNTMQKAASERLRMETDLRLALSRGEFDVHFQPQVDARDNRIVGAEAAGQRGDVDNEGDRPVAEDRCAREPFDPAVVKLHGNVDARYKLIRQMKITAANADDGQQLPDVLQGANTRNRLLADRGYDSMNRLVTLRFSDGQGDQDWSYWPGGKVKRVQTRNNGASTITKQDAGGTVFKIKDAAKNFCTNDQGSFGRTGFDHGVSHREGINEATAYRLNFKRRTACGAQFVLYHGRHRREHHVGRGRTHNDQVDVTR